MATTIFILIILAGYHFIMESCIIPLFRAELNMKLASLRDKLLMLRITDKENINDKTFHDLNGMICTISINLPRLNFLGLMLKKNRPKEPDPSIDTLINNFNKHKRTEIREIFDKTTHVAMTGYVLNSLSWALYILPFALVGLICFFIHKQYKKARFFLKIASKHKLATERTILLLSRQNPASRDFFPPDKGSANRYPHHPPIQILHS